MATEEGIVFDVKSGVLPTATVKIGRSVACNACASREACAESNNKKEIKIEVPNMVGVRKGDIVLLNVGSAPLLKATFLIYIFPILSMFGGVFVGNCFVFFVAPDTASNLPVVCAFLFLLISLWTVRTVGTRLSSRPEYNPKIIKIINRSNC